MDENEINLGNIQRRPALPQFMERAFGRKECGG